MKRVLVISQNGLLMKDKIVIIGLGYVGLPLAVSLSKYYSIIGIDQSNDRVQSLNKFEDLNKEINSSTLKKSKIKFFTNKQIKTLSADVFLITVPTPVNNANKPNLKNLIEACRFVAKFIRKKNLIIIESTIAPETTEKICLEIISKISKIPKSSINISFSPERINPGDKVMKIRNIAKVVSGNNLYSKKKVKKIYGKIIKKVVLANSIKSAELAKLVENTQRDINISFMNEIYKICDVYNLDYKHVLNLCSTKWNFVNFKPGLVGGHCVPVDPYYLVEDLKKKKYSSNLISLARENNENFVKYVLKKLINKIKPLKNKKILFCGINFKNNVYDKRNSKYYSIYLNLKKKYNCNLFLDTDSYHKNMDKHISNHNIFIIGSSNLNIKRLQKKILTEKKSKKVIISILSKRINSKNKNIKIINI